MNQTAAAGPTSVRPLFDVSLEYTPGLDRVTPEEHSHRGEYLGSGGGTIAGSDLEGTVRWDVFEVVGETRCDMEFAGTIETNSGDVVRFESTGYGFVADPAGKPHEWTVTHAIRFETDAPGLRWLADLGASLHGTYDMSTSRLRYQILAAAPAGAE